MATYILETVITVDDNEYDVKVIAPDKDGRNHVLLKPKSFQNGKSFATILKCNQNQPLTHDTMISHIRRHTNNTTVEQLMPE